MVEYSENDKNINFTHLGFRIFLVYDVVFPIVKNLDRGHIVGKFCKNQGMCKNSLKVFNSTCHLSTCNILDQFNELKSCYDIFE